MRQLSLSETPPLPRMSTLVSAPVIASNPVAYTITSSACSRSEVRTPVSVISAIGVRRRLTRCTFSRLYVS